MTYTGWQAAIIYVLGLSSPPGLTTTSPFLLSPAGLPEQNPLQKRTPSASQG